jgi:mannose/cellobiose epimerase-like protein (N-acyl-D-glucosamine 2-epimerase family)
MTHPTPDKLNSLRNQLLNFAKPSASQLLGGFGRLQIDGSIDESLGVETWINARMAYCFALEVVRGNQDARAFADHGLESLARTLQDELNGGWFEASGGSAGINENKAGYAHAFVLLAASALAAAKIKGADQLLKSAKQIIEKRFWSESDGANIESYNSDWSVSENYRGANSNMHMVEAFLACFDQTGEKVWLERALSITDRLLNVVARENSWRLPEHFDNNWLPVMDYNSEHKDHPFRPYGATVGHWFEWARLAIELHWALGNKVGQSPAWLPEVAEKLFDQAIQDGWSADGAPGFVYTVDWEGQPVVRLRMSWVICEAISAAHVLSLEFGRPDYLDWAEKFWDYALKYFPDREFGSWHSELDANNNPSHTVWSDKPDIYHLYQSLEFSKGHRAVSLISAVASGSSK